MISIVIINYRQKEFTINCVRSIYEEFKSYPFEVIVINNSSEDDLSFLESIFERIKIIDNINKGYSQANNLGAKNSSGEYLLFLNADTIMKSDFAKNLIQKFESEEFGALGLKLYNEDGTFQLSFGKEINFVNEMKNKEGEVKFRKRDMSFIENIENQYCELTEVEWVTGAAFLIRKDVFIKCGGFDERFFLYYEDADLCKRLKDAGLKNYFYPDSEIMHLKGENMNPVFDSDTYFFSKQSQLYYYRKHNNFLNNILLKTYLFSKFSLKYLFSFNKMYLKIIRETIGLNSK